MIHADSQDIPQATARYFTLLSLVVVSGLVGRLFHFYWTLGSDDQRWIIAARTLTGTEKVSIPAHYYGRILWRWTLAIWGLPWGLSLQSSAVLMFLLAGTSIVLVGLVTRLLFSERASLLAAALHATYPINVQFDPATLPDSLAVPLLLLSVFLFAKFLKEGRTGFLAGSVLAAGLLFSVKEYFALIALPFGLCLLCSSRGLKVKLRQLGLVSLWFCAGLSVDFLLHLLESGDILAHFRPLLTYSARSAELYQMPAYFTGLHRVYYLVDERFDYFRWILFDYGVVGGVLLAFGGLFLAFSCRKSQTYLLLITATVSFFCFLSAMPTSLSTLRFVETQSRYSMTFLPFLAIGAGAALSVVWENLSNTALRWSGGTIVSLVCLWNLWVPNSMVDRYNRRLEMVGIRACLDRATQSGVSQMVLPARYDQLLPDSYFHQGVSLAFAKQESNQLLAYGNLDNFLNDPQGTAFFVPLKQEQGISQKLKSLGFTAANVQVPETSLRSWLDKLGIHSQGQLVGWLYMRRDSLSFNYRGLKLGILCEGRHGEPDYDCYSLRA